MAPLKLGFRLVRTAPFDYGALTPRFLAPLLRRFHGVRDLHYELRITKEKKGWMDGQMNKER